MLNSLHTDLRDLWHARSFLVVLTRRELRSRVSGAALGPLWLYAQPLLTLAVFVLAFDVILRLRTGNSAQSHSMGLYLVVSMTPWMTFTDALTRGMHSLLEAGNTLKKNPIPPVLFPARAVLASITIYLPLLLIVELAGAQHFGPSLLAIPLLIACLVPLSFFPAYALSVLAVALRDVIQVVGFSVGLGLYLSPILFPMSLFPDPLKWLPWLNPITPIVLGLQSSALDGTWPEPAIWLAILAWLALFSLFCNRVVGRSRDRLVDWL
jgi:lipopolysaccharide transport system permease protein